MVNSQWSMVDYSERYVEVFPMTIEMRFRGTALAISFVLAIAGGACSSKPGTANKAEAASENKPAPVRVIHVEARQVRRAVESVGSLFPHEEVTVSSEVEGRVDQVLVDVGDRVAAGQPLVKVSPVELKLSVGEWRASVSQARARLGLPEGKEDLKDVREAAEVKKAAADLNDAEQKFARAKSLLDQGLLPRENFDESEAKLKAARAAYDLAVQNIENLRAQLERNKVTLELAEKKLTDTVIRAPFGGMVKERNVTQGQYLKVQTPVVVIVSVDPMRVRLKVPEKVAGWIRVGQLVTIAVEAYPGQTFSGKLSRINPSVDPQTRSFEAEALIVNHAGILKPGFFVKASIPSDRVEDGLFVPQSALRYNYGIYKVFVVEGGTIREKEIKIGDRAGDSVEVVEGLNKGDRLALPISGELRDGARIEIQAEI
jgi:membrane fusion protein (multidrug efflux system)